MAPPTASNVVYPTPTGFPLHKKQPPRISFAKTEPRPLGFCFFDSNRTPLAAHPIAPPHCLKPSVPHPNRMPSTQKNSSPAFRSPKPSSGSSVLGFWPQPVPPRASPNGTPPLPQTRCTPPQPGPLYAKKSPTAFHSPKLSPGSLVFSFWPNPLAPLNRAPHDLKSNLPHPVPIGLLYPKASPHHYISLLLPPPPPYTVVGRKEGREEKAEGAGERERGCRREAGGAGYITQ